MMLLAQWLMPLTRKHRYRLSIVLEILQAWQYVEVYLLAVLVASWQLGTFSGEENGRPEAITFLVHFDLLLDFSCWQSS